MKKDFLKIVNQSTYFLICYLFLSFFSLKLNSIKISIDFIFYDLFSFYSQKEENQQFAVVEYSDIDQKNSEPFQYLLKAISEIESYNPMAILATLPSHDFSINKKTRTTLCQIVNKNPNIFFGIYDRFWLNRFNKKYKENCNFYDAGTNRFFRQERLRRSFISDYGQKRFSISYAIAKKVSTLKKTEFSMESIAKNFIHDEENNKTLLINYKNLKKTTRISLTDVKNPEFNLKNKIVVLGNISPRKRTIHHRESSHVNTPWQTNLDSEVKGESLLSIYPVTISNLLQNDFIRQSKSYYNIFLFFLLFSLSYQFWKINRSIAFLYSFIQIVALLIISFLIFIKYSLFMDITSMVAYSYLGSFIGSFHREKKHIKVVEKKNKAILERLNMSKYDNKTFSRVINNTDKFIKESKENLEFFLDKSSLDQSLKNDIRIQIKNLSANTDDSCNYLKVLEIEKPKNKNFSLKKSIENTFATLRQEIIYKNIRTEIDIDKSISLNMDEILFKAILYNIISNAIKHGHTGTRVLATCKKEKKHLIIAICDQGPGFKKEKFEDNILYYNKSKKEDFYSSSHYGLGLYLSYLISQKISVSIALERNKDFNSIVLIKLSETQVSAKN